MKAISRIASLVTLAVIAIADSHDHTDELSIEIIATWDSITAGLFVSPESVEFNGDDNLWYLNNWFGFGGDNTTENKVGQISTLSGDYPVTESTNFDLQEDIMDTLATLPSGMVYSDGALFVGDLLAGVVHKFDTTTNAYVGAASTGTYTNGLCLDTDNNVLYATTTGIDFFGGTGAALPAFSGLWSIDPDTLDVTRLYDGASSGFPDGFVMAPNGCYVNDGVVYMVDYSTGSTGSLGMYNISSGELTRDAVVLADHPGCDGIVYYDGFWFVTDVVQGQLLALNTAEEDAIFEVVLSNLTGAADIGLGPDNTIAIPSPNVGTVWFAQFEIGHDHDEDSSAAHMCVFGALAVVAVSLF